MPLWGLRTRYRCTPTHITTDYNSTNQKPAMKDKSNGWIKLHRDFTKFEWYQDANTMRLFLHLLITANHKKAKWQGNVIDRGQLITSREHLSKELGLTVSVVRTSLSKLEKTENIKISALGGVGELGKNMYVVEINENIYVLDAGSKFPGGEMLGIDIVIPDITYLVENQQNVKGIFVTHGHEEQIGAIPFILQKLDVQQEFFVLKLSMKKNKV